MGDCFRELIQELLKTEHTFFFFMAPWNVNSLDFAKGRCEKILVEEDSHSTIGRALFGERVRKALKAVDRFSVRRLPRLHGRLASGDRHGDWRAHPASKFDLDLWFCPFTALEPRPVPLPSVVTIPDVQHEAYPQFFPEAELRLRRTYFPATCSMSSAILTLSEFSKKDIVDRYGVAPDRVHVVYTGVSPRFFTPDLGDAAVRAKYNLPERYLYYPANAWPHKNHSLLLIALRVLAATGRQVPPLVLSGAPLETASDLVRFADHLGVQVRHLGYLPYLDIPAIYRGARLLVFPSLFEGFGMPVIEAMAAGVPVAAASVTSLPEVIGDAGILFNPRKPDEIADAIDRLWNDEKLRTEMIRRGREQACRFSWAECARRTLEAFDEAVRVQNPATPACVSAQGLMSDNWMGRELVITVRGGEPRGILVEGNSPVAGSKLRRPTLVLSAGWRRLHRECLLPNEPFRLQCSLSGLKPPFELRLRAARTFIPRNEGWNDDLRELSIHFSRLEVEIGDKRIPLLNA